MQKLTGAGAAQKVTQEKPPEECWYIPHYLVAHNGKNRLVFNCSHQYIGQTLNQYLLPGPTLGASLVGVLLRFCEHPIAISGDIKWMFHQVCLLPKDRPLLRFLWRALKVDEPPPQNLSGRSCASAQPVAPVALRMCCSAILPIIAHLKTSFPSNIVFRSITAYRVCIL